MTDRKDAVHVSMDLTLRDVEQVVAGLRFAAGSMDNVIAQFNQRDDAGEHKWAVSVLEESAAAWTRLMHEFAAEPLVPVIDAEIVVPAFRIEIVGPMSGAFHVHGAGCADLAKSKYQGHRWPGFQWLSKVSSHQAIVEEIYSDFLPTDDDGNPTTWQQYDQDITVFPCVGKLPTETPA
jgi:hypothetical protein